LNPFARYRAAYIDGDNASGAPLFHAMLGLFLIGYRLSLPLSLPFINYILPVFEILLIFSPLAALAHATMYDSLLPQVHDRMCVFFLFSLD
jgi:hypothetical protein